MYLVHERRILDLSTSTATPCPLPSGQPLALAAHGPHAAIITQDLEVWRLAHGSWTHAYTIEDGIPDPELAALSANGELVVLAREDAIVALTLGDAIDVVAPDFFQHATSVACHPDGQSFGYGFLTSQPFAQWGSYGERCFGFVVSDSAGAVLRFEADERDHDEEPTFHGAWDPDAHLLVTAIAHDPGFELWSMDWARRLETSTSRLLVTIPELTDELTYDPPALYDTLPVVSHGGLAAASILDGELALTLREHWSSKGPVTFSWGEDLVAVSLAAWPEIVALRRDGAVVRASLDEVLTYAAPLGP